MSSKYQFPIIIQGTVTKLLFSVYANELTCYNLRSGWYILNWEIREDFLTKYSYIVKPLDCGTRKSISK